MALFFSIPILFQIAKLAAEMLNSRKDQADAESHANQQASQQSGGEIGGHLAPDAAQADSQDLSFLQ